MKKRIAIVLAVFMLLAVLTGCGKSVEEKLIGRWVSVSYIQYDEEQAIDPESRSGNYTEINFASESSASLIISEGTFDTNWAVINSNTFLLYGKELRWGGFYLCIEGIYENDSGLLKVTTARGVTIILQKQ